MRSRIATSTSSASAVAAALVLLAGGCGDAKSADAKRDCQLAAEQRLAERIARNAYNAGRLGGPAQFRAYFKGRNQKYLDANGKLLPISQLKGQTRWDFERWVAHVESKPGIGDRMHAARMELRKQGAPGC
jgi:hypothetical protein